MTKKKICIIAQFPPPIHGLSKAVDTLYNSKKLNEKYDLVKINITNNKRFLSNYHEISKTNADLFYFTISQSIGGNIRDLMILRLLRKQGKKCLIHLHGGYYRTLYDEKMYAFQRRWNVREMKALIGAIVLGESLKYIFDGLIDENKIYVVPNCIDDKFLISEKEFLEKIDRVEETYHVLYLSNFIRSKGYDVVLELAKKYKEGAKNIKLHFDFAGMFYDDNERQFFEQYIKQYGLEDVITYHGIVTGDAKRNLLKNSTFFALPTTYPKEGQPISLLEAMGNGLVILTTTHAGIPDVVKDDLNGCVKDADDELAKCYLNYISEHNRDDLIKIQVLNRQQTVQKYNEANYINNLINCFEDEIG